MPFTSSVGKEKASDLQNQPQKALSATGPMLWTAEKDISLFITHFCDSSETSVGPAWKQRGKELRQVAQGRGEPAEVIKEGAGRKTNIHVALFEVPGTIISSVVLFHVSQHADS